MTEIEATTEGETDRKEQARQLIGQAGQTLKHEAQSFASAAQERVRAEAQKGTKTATKTLGDFAEAVRVAGERLAESDQSPASRLVRQAADGLESLSRNLAEKEPEDLLNAVRDFGRKNPAAFIGGAVLVGLALGRFVRASETHKLPRISDEHRDDPMPDNIGGLRTAASAAVADDLTPEGEDYTIPSPPGGV